MFVCVLGRNNVCKRESSETKIEREREKKRQTDKEREIVRDRHIGGRETGAGETKTQS